MWKKYLKSFVVGSSLPVFYLFFNAVISYEKEGIIRYSFDKYAILAPLYFGIMTMFATVLGPLRESLFVTSLLSSLFIMTLIRTKKLYSYNNDYLWYRQYFRIFFGHMIAYNIIIYYILINIC